ncbi:FKBP-type peptidyl-prolyl cis-trans isomerase [Halalkalirubrum salinum]|uniref:FKBP-type peptidyl-prolyl cis-trans isomerase n=1 Tax=Halalkalirubrum salinum TaxID=2563889 RepID=UPI0010FB4513|nr:peptidylprolyl isomerase [Halalkalirubrum salinum]
MSDEQEAEAAEAAADADDVDAEEETPEESAGLQNGDFIKLAYTVRTVEDGTVVDTTDKEIAEEEGIDDDNYDFSPRTIIIGEGHIFQAVDEALVGASVGESGTVEIPAVEAFGEYDPDQVRTVSADKIGEDDRYPGAQVTIDGEQGHIETIIGGRARVNFNHPLAGEDLEYDYEIVDVVDDREAQASGLLGMYLQSAPNVWIQTDEVEEETIVEPDEDDADDDADAADDEDDEDVEPETEIEIVEKETLYIEATPQLTMNQQWMFSKQQIAQDVMSKLDLDRVIVQETIEGPGGMGGMMGGLGGLGGAGGEDIEAALDDVDLDTDELAQELTEE